jgi:hypothetical protein
VRSVAILALVLAGCSAPAVRDQTKETWYPKSVAELAAMNRDADQLFRAGKGDDAAAVIQKAQPVMAKVLEVQHPTVEAAEAASDLDDLYGRMLLSNRHYGWAQMMFQKNLSRWKHWDPQTEETARRVKQAESQIAECTKLMER